MNTHHDADPEIEHLSPAECWRLICAHTIGRLAIDSYDGGPDLMPMNYRVDGHSILIRSAPGSKLRSIRTRPQVAFEIDGMGPGHFWSVVIRGDAYRLSSDEDIERSGVLDLVSSAPGAKHNFIRLTPTTISGRRFADAAAVPAPAPAPAPTTATSTSAQGTHPRKPHPIPHYPPKSPR